MPKNLDGRFDLRRPPERAADRAERGSSVLAHGIYLYWLPLGAGGNFVRLNGKVYEAVAARLQQRPPCDLYHSALQVVVPRGRYVIEQTPVIDAHGSERGVVAEGPDRKSTRLNSSHVEI